MPKFEINEICLVIQDVRGPIAPLDCEVKAIEPRNLYGPYIIEVPGHRCPTTVNGTWSAPESWLRKKPRPGADIVRDLIKNVPLSIIDDLEKEEEKCHILK